MLFQYFEVNKLPVAIIDNFYENNELELIHKEIEYFHCGSHFLEPGKTGSDARLVGGDIKYKRKNLCIQLDSFYTDRQSSSILASNRKIFNPELVDELTKNHSFFGYLHTSTKDITKLHYYDDGDYYEPHLDIAVITVMTWIYNQPKQFEGGNLKIENELVVRPQYNRTVILPSILTHEVEKISIETSNISNPGRYTITQFIGFK